MYFLRERWCHTSIIHHQRKSATSATLEGLNLLAIVTSTEAAGGEKRRRKKKKKASEFLSWILDLKKISHALL
jgi:hypothetical protein